VGRSRHLSMDRGPGCPVEGALELIDGKWKGVVLFHLLSGTMRFNELRRQLKNCTQRMLTNQLRDLEADGLVHRKIYPEVPPKVEYSLTPRGRTLEPVILALKKWGEENVLPPSPPKASDSLKMAEADMTA